ncbi:hypothetical protein CEQ90_04735 [Lewinellaceae bacterium SD302]|nr:hypothetical protein CEQ90_04735 [Lewinellaceae bacterium SD302]
MNFRILLVLVNLLLVLCILIFAGLLLDGKVDEFFDHPVVVMDDRPIINMNEDKRKQYSGRTHPETGLIYAEGYELVKANCTVCHSAKLVTQNRASRQGWAEMIDWMQRTQGLWELGANEPKILDYLAEHYAPEETGRRANLDVEAIEWYVLDLEKDE